MNERENILALLKGEEYERVPIWLMGFDNEDAARRLNPGVELPLNLSHNPERENYPWDRLTDEERQRTLNYNCAVMKPAVVVGWGANQSLGHGGPGEFHFSLIDLKENERTLICETGCKRLVKKNPHFYMDFDYPMKTIGDTALLKLPDPYDNKRYKGFAEDVKFFKEAGYIAAANLNGFFSGPHYFCLDYQEFLMSLMLDPENSKKLIEIIGEWNIAAAGELLKRGVECIILCDDLGSADNLLVSPEIYDEMIFPWHKKLCGLAHEYGAFVHLHSHGDINKILPKVLSAGFDILNPFDKNESMDLVEYLNGKIAKTFPAGGLHKDFFLWDRNTQDDYLKSLFSRAKKAGRWIFMEPAGISEGTSLDSYKFFMERLRGLSKL
jgi:uroporphyrinogen-III decarboxylase